MENNGNKLRQQCKDMKQVFKLKIDASGQNLAPQDARNLAAALTEMPQLLVLDIWIHSNNLANDGAASIAQALSTLKNLTQLTLII
jgi:ABC-type protease/lipase transport system fused ATPase/permease subunit